MAEKMGVGKELKKRENSSCEWGEASGGTASVRGRPYARRILPASDENR